MEESNQAKTMSKIYPQIPLSTALFVSLRWWSIYLCILINTIDVHWLWYLIVHICSVSSFKITSHHVPQNMPTYLCVNSHAVTFLPMRWVESSYCHLSMVPLLVLCISSPYLLPRLPPAVKFAFLLHHQFLLFHWIDLTGIHFYSNFFLDILSPSRFYPILIYPRQQEKCCLNIFTFHFCLSWL